LVGVLERYEVSYLITNGAGAESDPAFAALLEAAEARGVPIDPAQLGETILPDDGVRLEILHTGPADTGDSRNDASIVALLTYGELSLLLTGDAEAAAETALLQSGRPLDTVILKAGHHGANTSSSERFLQAVSPQIVVISAGIDNSYGHPHPAMLARVEGIGAMVLRTDQIGTVEVVSDGRRMWWEAERSPIEGQLP
jgi:competence protein ComEC